MSAGSVLIMIAEHFRIVQQNPAPTQRENMLMSTLTRLSAVMDKLVTDSQALSSENATLKASETEKDSTISDLKAQLATAQQTAVGAASETDLEGLIAKGEAVTGHVDDPTP